MKADQQETDSVSSHGCKSSMKMDVLKSFGLKTYGITILVLWDSLVFLHAVGLQLHSLTSVGFLQLFGKQCCILLETILIVNANEHLEDFCISIIKLISTFKLRWGGK